LFNQKWILYSSHLSATYESANNQVAAFQKHIFYKISDE